MLLTLLAIGGTLLGAATVAGMLVVYQVRQSADAASSAKAIFAADAGIEWGLYQFFGGATSTPAPVLGNGASFTVTCAPANDCRSATSTAIQALGTASNVARALELAL